MRYTNGTGTIRRPVVRPATPLTSPVVPTRTNPMVLGIPVSPEVVQAWCGWLAPEAQPFLVSEWPHHVGERRTSISPELRDTFALYNEQEALPKAVWLSEEEFSGLAPQARRRLVREQVERGREAVPTVSTWGALAGPAAAAQAGGRRFVWWQSLLRPTPLAVLGPYIVEGRLPSRHAEVPARFWRTAERLLPLARELGGTFPSGSGPNCFGAVMAASGVLGAEEVWMQREPFEQWLADHAVPGGRDDDVGTVLVWRSPDGAVQHAAVTLGGGFALHKPSQGWMSPTKVLFVSEVKVSAREVGRRLMRYRLVRTD